MGASSHLSRSLGPPGRVVAVAGRARAGARWKAECTVASGATQNSSELRGQRHTSSLSLFPFPSWPHL